VGSASLLSTVLRGVAREIVVVNRDPKRARAVVADMQYGASLSPAVDIRAGDYSDLNGAALVMIAAGTNEKAGGATDRTDPTGRLRLLGTNIGVYQQILPKVRSAAHDAVILVLTDPPDPASRRWKGSGRDRFHTRARLTLLPNLTTLDIEPHAHRGLSPGAKRRVLEYVDAHFDEPLTLESLARVAGLSVHHLRGASDSRRGNRHTTICCDGASNARPRC
jgi:L-lactate dehydrogenase